MGQVCLKAQGPELLEPKDLQGDWAVGKLYFNLAYYKALSPTNEDLAFQRILAKTWGGHQLTYVFCSGTEVAFLHDHFLDYYQGQIFAGVPHKLMKRLLRNIFVLPDRAAKVCYEQLLDEVSEDNECLLDCSYACLTGVGRSAAHEIYLVFQSVYPEVSNFTYLPRLIELLLWFLEDYEVLAVLMLMQKTKRVDYFPSPVLKHKLCLDEQLSVVAGSKVTEQLRAVSKDMVESLLVGYVYPCYYPYVLSRYLSGGICAVNALAVSVLQSHQAAYVQLASEVCNLTQFVEQFREYCRRSCEFSRVLDSLAIAKDCILTRVPLVSIQDASSKLETTVSSVLPEKTWLIPVPCAVQTRLFSCLATIRCPVFLNIQTDESVGIYLDRSPAAFAQEIESSSSCVVRSAEHTCTRHQSNCPLRLSLQNELKLVNFR